MSLEQPQAMQRQPYPPTQANSPPTPSSSAACLDRPDDALSTSSGPFRRRIGVRVSIWRQHAPAAYGWCLCACVWRFHERPDGGDGIPGGKDRLECRTGVYGAERERKSTAPAIQALTGLLQLKGYVSISALKHYFNVTTIYVLRKLLLVLFPWRHKPWSRQQRPSTTGSQDQSSYSYYFLPPREDINSPDMYIPVMAFVSYILLSTLLAGLRGAFHPEVMGSTFGYALFVVVVEILILKMGTYILSITNESQLLDLIAYSGYKFVGVIVTLTVSEIFNLGRGTGGWIGWTVFIYTFLANAFFLVPLPQSLKRLVLM